MVVGVSRGREAGRWLRIYEWTHRHLPGLVDCRPICVREVLEAAGFEIREVEHGNIGIPVETVLATTPTHPVCAISRTS